MRIDRLFRDCTSACGRNSVVTSCLTSALGIEQRVADRLGTINEIVIMACGRPIVTVEEETNEEVGRNCRP